MIDQGGTATLCMASSASIRRLIIIIFLFARLQVAWRHWQKAHDPPLLWGRRERQRVWTLDG